MTSTTLSRCIRSLSILALLMPVGLLAGTPKTPEPKVIATITSAPGHPSACTATLEVRHPDSDEVLSAPRIALMAGQTATTTTSSADVKVEASITAAPACAGGTYDVRVLTKGSVPFAKKGTLTPAAK